MAEKPLTPSASPSHRIICWGMPRSLSTVFEKCLSFVDGIQIINEPFQCASTTGPEGALAKMGAAQNQNTGWEDMSKAMEKVEEEQGWDDSLCTYKFAKDMLERDFPDKKLVFCKDLITGIIGHFDMLPKGYLHTFIIRNPVKVMISTRRGLTAILPPGTDTDAFDMSESPFLKILPGFGFSEELALIEHLKSTGESTSDPIIIDADDLQNHPESIVRQYCEKTGIPYSDSLLQWEGGDGIVKRNWMIAKGFLQGNKIMHYFDAAFASTCFQPAKDPLPELLTPDVVKLAATLEPDYRKLYEMRIKP